MTRTSGFWRDGHAKQFERLFDDGTAVGLTEAQLVERFAANRDESAFVALVDRHGPMVLGVCRRFLRDPNDVDDAFQAVFLVLARKAGGLREKDLLANWLYGVACKVAARSRTTAARRAVSDPGDRLETDARKPTAVLPAESLARIEDEARLHEEVDRLPTRYRAPVVACYFEGKTHEEAAAHLGCPVGTVKGRLARARDLLRRRLERRGVVAPAAALATALASPDLRAAVPPALAARSVRLAVAVASSPTAWMTTTAVSTSVRFLSEGVIQAMFHAQLKSLALPAALAAAGLLIAGASLAAYQEAGDDPADNKPPKQALADPNPALVKQDATTTQAKRPGASGSEVGRQGIRRPTSPTSPTPAAGMMGAGMMGAGAMGPGAMGPGMMGPGMMGPGMMGPGMMPGMGMGRTVSGRGGVAPLSLSMARLSAFLATEDVNPENRSIHEALDQRITLELQGNSTLGDLVKRIQDVQLVTGKPMPVFVSKSGLRDAEADLSTSVELDLKEVPLRSALRLALGDIGLAYCVRDGILIISSFEDINMELLQAQAEMIGRNSDKYALDAQGLIQKKQPPRAGGGFQ